jgi:hypothetical protein
MSAYNPYNLPVIYEPQGLPDLSNLPSAATPGRFGLLGKAAGSRLGRGAIGGLGINYATDLVSKELRGGKGDQHAGLFTQMGQEQDTLGDSLSKGLGSIGGLGLGGLGGLALSGMTGGAALPLVLAGALGGKKIAGAMQQKKDYTQGKEQANTALSNMRSRITNSTSGANALGRGFDQASAGVRSQTNRGMQDLSRQGQAASSKLDQSRVKQGLGGGAAMGQSLRSQMQTQKSMTDLSERSGEQLGNIAAQKGQAL